MGTPNFAIEPDSGLALADEAAAPAAFAAQFIPAGARVLDLGGDAADLHGILPHGCAYMACGRTASAEGALACHLEAGEFPAAAASGADIIVMLGLLERIGDADALFAHLRAAGRTVLLSYPARDLAGSRAARGANNQFGFYDLTRLFDRHGFRIECSAPFGDGRMLMRLIPEAKLNPLAPCRVAVVSNGDDFGERIGRQMIASVLPGEAAIDWLTFDRLGDARSHYDLVVLGVGGGLAPPMIDDRLTDIVSRGRAAIGIFGTQYRELMPRAGVERLIGELDVWYARHEADVLMYGRGDNVVHLGDWRIGAFPLAQADDDEPLLIGGNAGADSDLARTIAHIQRHKRVYSTQATALLCALTSAETAAYSEPADSRLPGVASGEFRSLLVDVFGRGYPDKDFFLIDRDAVMRYRARVMDNVAAMRDRIAALARASAAAAA